MRTNRHEAFLDTETVTLEHPTSDVIWEVGLILRDPDRPLPGRWRWQIRPDVTLMSDFSRPYFDKSFEVPDGQAAMVWTDLSPKGRPCTKRDVAMTLMSLTDGRHVIGAMTDFDVWRLRFFCERWAEQTPGWRYHLIELESLVQGYLLGLEKGRELERKAQIPFPNANQRRVETLRESADKPTWLKQDGDWKSDDLYRATGVDPTKYARHTALGDCELNMAVYDKVWGR